MVKKSLLVAAAFVMSAGSAAGQELAARFVPDFTDSDQAFTAQSGEIIVVGERPSIVLPYREDESRRFIEPNLHVTQELGPLGIREERYVLLDGNITPDLSWEFANTRVKRPEGTVFPYRGGNFWGGRLIRRFACIIC